MWVEDKKRKDGRRKGEKEENREGVKRDLERIRIKKGRGRK